MHRRLQFGMRENPASDRRYGSRQVVQTSPNRNCVEQQNAGSSPPALGQTQAAINTDSNSDAALPYGATRRKKGDTVTHPDAAFPPASYAMIPRDFEPLIDSCEAAHLLGNIHVKTLQRYARHQRIPGYQIGGHWYFRASELDSWLRSQINLSCHPCRSNEEAK